MARCGFLLASFVQNSPPQELHFPHISTSNFCPCSGSAMITTIKTKRKVAVAAHLRNLWPTPAWLNNSAWKTPRVNICSVRVKSLLIRWHHNHSDHSAVPWNYPESGVNPYSLMNCALLQWFWLALPVDTEFLQKLIVATPLSKE